MKAAIYEKYGSPDVLQIKEVEKPTPGDKEVLIKVYAATVNRTDCAMLRAKPFIMRFLTGLFKPKNPILGTDFAGIIKVVGKDVESFKIGDKVFGFDDNGISSHAQFMTISADNALAIIPDNTSYEEATASIEGAHYAYNIINKVALQIGQRVLVNGATGAIGSALVQLLKYFDLNVTAVGNTKNIDLMKSIGADKVIDYTNEDFTRSNEKYDFVFDAVGKSTFTKCKPLLINGGIYISSELGPGAQNLFYSLATPISSKLPGTKGKKVIFPMPIDRHKSVLFVKSLIEESKFKAVIDRRYSLEEIADAFRFVEKGQKTGNVVITPNNS